MSQTGSSRGNGSAKHYDVVIVGAGIAGAMVALRLSEAERSVLILEAGRATSLTPDGYRSYVENYYQALAKPPNASYPDNPNAPSPTVMSIQKIAKDTPSTAGYFVQKGPLPFGSDYLQAQGGTTLHWLGSCPRMVPNDFRLRSAYGVGIDWPLSYDDLKPYYARAEWEIGVSADVEEQQFLGITFEEGYRYPMRKIPQSYLDRRVMEGVRGMTVAVGDERRAVEFAPMAQGRNSIPNRDPRTGETYRPAGMIGEPDTGERCEGNASCVPICPVQAKYNALKTLSRLRKENVDIVTQAVATKIEIDAASGKVTGITYQLYQDENSPFDVQTCTAQGTLYVIAGNAIETPKLLLASGAANSSDQVGRNLMDHPTMLTWGLMPEPIGSYRGPGSTTNIRSFRDGDFRRDHAVCIVPLDNWGWSWAAFDPGVSFGNMVNTQNLFGPALRREIGATLTRQFTLQFEFEQLPEPTNRVTIDPRYMDALGNFRPVIEYDLSDYTRAGMTVGRAISKEIFQQLKVEDCTQYSPSDPAYLTYEGEGFAYRGAGHLVGTHRIGTSRWNSVTDSNLRAWDHPNLYLVGTGSMPTIGTSNPTLTMTALALRAAEGMLKELGN